MTYLARFTASVRDQWVAALRSGRYKQGHDQLTTYVDEDGQQVDVRYVGTPGIERRDCCLGVLNKELNLGLVSIEPDLIEYHTYDPIDTLIEGLTVGMQSVLTRMNDGNVVEGIRKHTFDEIADYIEGLPVVDDVQP